jgi:hypothetical protein
MKVELNQNLVLKLVFSAKPTEIANGRVTHLSPGERDYIEVVVTSKRRWAAASSFASNQRRVSFDNQQELDIEILATQGATEEQRKPKRPFWRMA